MAVIILKKLNMKSPSIKNILSNSSKLEDRLVNDYGDLKKLVKLLKEQDYRVVLTQGVWDLLHEGHANYLQKARERGDILVVGVDSDEFTRKRKGPSRPVVPQKERMHMLAHVRCVDILTIREDTGDIDDLVKTVEPDVFVVSTTTKDFKSQMEHLKQWCGEVCVFEPQSTTSTTARIRSLSIEEAEKLAKEVKDMAETFIDKIKNGNK
jgi:D-glycero-beta-D-manno-heptose 1-phosphate adenylyltransferase